jgi:hypothetical protein
MVNLGCMVMGKLTQSQKLEAVSRQWKWGQAQVTHFWMSYLPSIINVWTKYSEPRLYGNLKIDLIAKT